MAKDVLDRLLITLAVRLHAFSICQIEEGWRLAFGPLEGVTIHHVLDGRGSVRAEDGTWVPFSPYSVVIVPAHQAHKLGDAGEIAREVRGEDHCTLLDNGLVTFTAGDGRRDILLLCGMIPATYAGALGMFEHLSSPLVQDLSANNVARNTFDLMRAEVAEPTVGAQAFTEALMKQCLILLLRQHLARDVAQSPLFARLRDPRLARTLTVILEHPAVPHTVESLASVAGMSRAAFAERFAQAFGQGPIEFVGKVRLRIAAQLLTTTDLPVKTIVSSIGYASRSYFSRAFRAAYGLDPRTYREVGGQEEREPERINDGSSAALASELEADEA